MADNVVDINEYQETKVDSLDQAHEAFLLEEGLELLSVYRQILDPRMRKALNDLARALAGISSAGT